MSVIDTLLDWATIAAGAVVLVAVVMIFTGIGSSPASSERGGDDGGYDPRYPRDHPRNRPRGGR